MRLIAALAALAMLAGCSATTATSGPVVASPSPTSSSPSPTPSMTPTPTPSATPTPTPVSSASAAANTYVAAERATGTASGTDDEILGAGQYYCEDLDKYYVQDPMQAVSDLIENAWRVNAWVVPELGEHPGRRGWVRARTETGRSANRKHIGGRDIATRSLPGSFCASRAQSHSSVS
jgi:hypothetical protein